MKPESIDRIFELVGDKDKAKELVLLAVIAGFPLESLILAIVKLRELHRTQSSSSPTPYLDFQIRRQ